MIDFELTEDHKAIQQTVRDFATKEVAPRIKELDEKQIFDRSILSKMAELNLLGVCIPEEYGGAGGTFAHETIINREIAQTLFGKHPSGLDSEEAAVAAIRALTRAAYAPSAGSLKLSRPVSTWPASTMSLHPSSPG